MGKLPYNRNLKAYAKSLRKSGNLSEVLLWQELKSKKLLALDFDRQKIIGNYIVDFYCKSLGVVIEIDGTSHDFKVKYDMKREAYLQGFNLLIIHILDIDIKQNLTGVLAYLHQQLKDKMMQMK